LVAHRPVRHRRPARAGALGPAEFSQLLTAPFEAKPAVAVAVSGGADSLALALLAAQWAKARGGRAVALTVDHGLRPESAREARQVARWLRARGISHRTLKWTGPKPRTGLQAAARAARYDLLRDWCERNGVLHLLVAHTREDQAETVLLRLARGSGADGLAGMPSIAEGRETRLLRPLLGISKSRLIAALTSRGQPWIEDPSNRDEAFARVTLRNWLSGFPGLPARIAKAGHSLGLARAKADALVATWLGRNAAIYPSGYVAFDAAGFRRASLDIATRVLARALAAVSGAEYPARRERLERLVAELKAGASARTLGGCRVIRKGEAILICREWSRAETLRPVPSVRTFLWDGRFRIELAARRGMSLRLGPLGEKGWAEAVKLAPGLRRSPIPLAARLALPALFDSRGPISVPHLGFARTKAAALLTKSALWQPANPLTTAGFSVAKGWRRTI
jgi:tRNA(Ile)-lysidine synthase